MDRVFEYIILDKLKTAREYIDKYSLQNDDGSIRKLREITNKAEAVYNEVRINRIRSYAALITMKDIELDLDNIIREVKKIKN